MLLISLLPLFSHQEEEQKQQYGVSTREMKEIRDFNEEQHITYNAGLVNAK